MQKNLPTLNFLWVSGRLSYLEKLCIQSALDLGHPVVLYTYFGFENAPKGIIEKDGREILPEEKMITYSHRGNISYALGSDLFRYYLMQHDTGIWFDTDVYLIKPIKIKSNHIFGWQQNNYVNGAVLYLSKNSKILERLLNFTNTEPCVPPWWPLRKKLVQRTRALIGREQQVENMKWGVFGPRALTHFIKELKLEHEALPKDVFYPVHWKQADVFFDPNYKVEQHITQNTVAVHLWNEVIKKYKTAPPPKGSFIYEACIKHSIEF